MRFPRVTFMRVSWFSRTMSLKPGDGWDNISLSAPLYIEEDPDVSKSTKNISDVASDDGLLPVVSSRIRSSVFPHRK